MDSKYIFFVLFKAVFPLVNKVAAEELKLNKKQLQ